MAGTRKVPSVTRSTGCDLGFPGWLSQVMWPVFPACDIMPDRTWICALSTNYGDAAKNS